jgi:hypothetical protein
MSSSSQLSCSRTLIARRQRGGCRVLRSLLVASFVGLPGLAPAITGQVAASGTEFLERFALSEDRAATVDLLIPGTKEAYFYRCLELQQRGAFDEVEAVLTQWRSRHGRSSQMETIQNRQAMLTYDRNRQATYGYLLESIRPTLSHRRVVSGQSPDLPTKLDPKLVDRALLSATFLRNDSRGLTSFTDEAYEYLATQELTELQLGSLLGRLTAPDVPGLVSLVMRDLGSDRSSGFGSREVHRHLLLAQLDACARQLPDLLESQNFIRTYVTRLQAADTEDWRGSSDVREAYLERLQSFVEQLPPSQNSFRAHVIYNRLVHDRQQARHDRALFLDYIRLPREHGVRSSDYLKRTRHSSHLVRPSISMGTGLPELGDDEHLLRAYLTHFFRTEDNVSPFTEFLSREYVERVFAEAKILYGLGDMERWYSLFDDPAGYEALKERVEIEFAPDQRTHHGALDEVALELDVKNVPTLLVKVFELNTFNIYAETLKEIDASLALDGLVANEEISYSYDDNPLRRVRRHFEFPMLAKPGVYVVDFIGNGLSSRAIVRKGQLRVAERVGAAGHVFRVFDEAGAQLPDATLWLSGREYTADEDGEIRVPFSTVGGARDIILRHGAVCTLTKFNHLVETYKLDAGAYLDVESLLSLRSAEVVLRPSLRVNGRPASVALLKDLVLTITSVDQDGVETSQEVRDFELFDDRESTHTIRVPEKIANLTLVLKGGVRSRSRGEDVELRSLASNLSLNGIEATAQTLSPLLGRTSQGYVLDVLGKSGEPARDRPVSLSFQHRDFSRAIDVNLKTDDQGRIHLGALEGIRWVTASGIGDRTHPWPLIENRISDPGQLVAAVGELLTVPDLGAEKGLDRTRVSLIERRAGSPLRDRFEHLSLVDGLLELRDLPEGNYELRFKGHGRVIDVDVLPGNVQDGWVVGPHWLKPVSGEASLHIQRLALEGENLEVRLAHAGPETRVSLVAVRYLPAFELFDALYAPSVPGGLGQFADHSISLYAAGREIGDEYRYILERRFAQAFPGNMLTRPGLLLNPWAVDESDTSLAGRGGAGTGFGRKGKAGSRDQNDVMGGGGGGGSRLDGFLSGGFANLDFLPEPSVLLSNLRPDADGVVRIPRAALGAGHLVQVVAMDGDQTVSRSLVLAETPLAPEDLRLKRALDPDTHVTEQRRIEYLAPGGHVVIEDVTTSGAELYDSLESVFRLFKTLSGNAGLDTFADLMRWPELDQAEKLAFYSEHACHELHLFILKKDRIFFHETVRPYLANKMDKTFMDRWLLGDDLTRFASVWEYGQLNVVERILLGERIEGQHAVVVRQLDELLQLIPVDTVAARRRFETALQGAALEAEGTDLNRVMSSAAQDADEEMFVEESALKSLGYLNGTGGASAASRAPPSTPQTAGALALTARARMSTLKKDVRAYETSAAFYRQPERTRELAEQNYWKRRIREQGSGLIPVNAFWLDLARKAPGTGFFSTHLTEPTSSVNEMLLALALLDLPFASAEHTTEVDGRRLSLTVAGPTLLVRKELLPAQVGSEQAPVLVSQGLFQLTDRYRFDGNERYDKFVSGEFLAGEVYGCKVVVTNPTSATRKLELLLQIPRGAIPVQKGFFTRGLDVRLGASETRTIEYFFYFPSPGDFDHFPVHIAREGELVTFAEAERLHVVAELSELDTTSWEHVSQNGSLEQVLAYLQSANLQRLDLSRIAWRMTDRDAYDRIVGGLRTRQRFDAVLWAYALQHRDLVGTREYLQHRQDFVSRSGLVLSSPLLDIDPVERRTYEHLEYEPLFNQRAHPFGRQAGILSPALAVQYNQLLNVLSYRPRLNDLDWMAVTYYLLLQDRVADAVESIARVDPDALETRLQYDYARAYLDFFTEEHALARGIAAAYREHPVERWRTRFQDILNQLDEAEGAAPEQSDPEDRSQQMDALAASEPSLELEVEARRVQLRHANLSECELRYYAMDIEFLFSTSPFVQQGAGSFAFIRPNRLDVVALDEGEASSGVTSFDLPEEFRSANVLVEARAGALLKRQPYYAHDLDVKLRENYGQLQVSHADTGRPIPRVYVKVFARQADGTVRFHKDGYTDLRGKFDYVSLSAATGPVARYALLILSEADGAVIREAAAPVE